MESLQNYENMDTKVDDLKQEFIDTVDSRMSVKLDYEKKDVDYEWLDRIEETLYYIDNILRNPKKFIINEEEIVKVELARKVTVESVIHLTQHTNLIQDFDMKTGDVQPSKILNINKEESLDTYENRFIYTLIKNMNYFLDQHEQDIIGSSYCNDIKRIKYDAETNLDSENIRISLSLNSSSKKNSVPEKVNGLTIKERFAQIRVQMAGFMNSELYQTLTKLHVPDVRPPIRKTNVILKNPNFQKANDLWNFFQSYDSKNFTLIKDNQDYMEVGPLKEKFDESFLINYLLMDSLSKDSSKKSIDKVVSMTVGKIVQTILDQNEDITKDKFNEMIDREYLKAKEKISNRDRVISNIFNDKFNRIEDKINNVISILS